MVLAPINENAEEDRIKALEGDVVRGFNNQIEQILIPIVVNDFHWYTVQLVINYDKHEKSIEAIIYDSLFTRAYSRNIESLGQRLKGKVVIEQKEGDLPKIQQGTGNVYCGGYTARLIANLVEGENVDSEAAWDCQGKRNDELREEDVRIVNENNMERSSSFGRADADYSLMSLKAIKGKKDVVRYKLDVSKKEIAGGLVEVEDENQIKEILGAILSGNERFNKEYVLSKEDELSMRGGAVRRKNNIEIPENSEIYERLRKIGEANKETIENYKAIFKHFYEFDKEGRLKYDEKDNSINVNPGSFSQYEMTYLLIGMYEEIMNDEVEEIEDYGDEEKSQSKEKGKKELSKKKEEARKVEEYYSDIDVPILLDSLLTSKGVKRIAGGEHQDIVEALAGGERTNIMVLAPINENAEKDRIAALERDVVRGFDNQIEQILVPIVVNDFHWYTVQLVINYDKLEKSIEAIIYDSLFTRDSSRNIENLGQILKLKGKAVIEQKEGDLPKIQQGTGNVYCGGYTARLIANLVKGENVDSEAAWGCQGKGNDELREEDVRIVNENNMGRSSSFGRADADYSLMSLKAIKGKKDEVRYKLDVCKKEIEGGLVEVGDKNQIKEILKAILSGNEKFNKEDVLSKEDELNAGNGIVRRKADIEISENSEIYVRLRKIGEANKEMIKKYKAFFKYFYEFDKKGGLKYDEKDNSINVNPESFSQYEMTYFLIGIYEEVKDDEIEEMESHSDKTKLEQGISDMKINYSSEEEKDEQLVEDFNDLSLKSHESNFIYFPRCEYYTRFEGTTYFAMSEPDYFGTYFRSTGSGGNSDRYSKLVSTADKAYGNELINSSEKNKLAAKTGSFRSPFFHKKYQTVVSSKKSKDKLEKINNKDFLYDDILKYKRSVCAYLDEKFTEIKDKKKIEITVSYSNEYSCIIVSLPCLSNKGSIASWYQMAGAYYVAIVNKYAKEQFVPIESIARSSFGHNIPSIADTGTSFRINIGVIPKIYADILVQSLVKLGEIMDQLKNADLGKDFLQEKNEEIQNYNTKYKKNIPKWEGKLFDTLNLKGDGKEKKVMLQIMRMKKYVDLLTDGVIVQLEKNKEEGKGEFDDMEKPLIELLSNLKYSKKITLKVPDVQPFQYSSKAKLEFSDKENKKIEEDQEFWSILEKICISLGQMDALKKQIAAKQVYGIYALLEQGNIEFIKDSGDQEAEDGVGSDSDCEVEDEEQHFYSRKITVATGMKSINLAAYAALYYVTKMMEVDTYKILTSQMYYETTNAIKLVLNAFSGVFEIPKKVAINSKGEAEILFFDLNHCNAVTAIEQKKLGTMIQYATADTLIILDYTSAIASEIYESVIKCLKKTNMVLLVSSGLKNEQAGADFNPYGTLRIVASDYGEMLEVYNFLKEALTRSYDIVPSVAHKIRKAYKEAGFVVTNCQIYGDKLKKGKIKVDKNEEEKNVDCTEEQVYSSFNYWDFIDYVDAINKLKLLGFDKKEIIDFYNQEILAIIQQLLEEFEEEISIDHLKNLDESKMQRLAEIFRDYHPELERLLTSKPIGDILSWDNKKIEILGGDKVGTMLSNNEEDFDVIEGCYDEDSDITKDLIYSEFDFSTDFKDSFDRYQNKKEIYEKTQREDPGSLIQEFDPLGEMKGEDIEDGCPDEYFVNSEESYNEREQDYSLEASDVPDIIEYFSKHAYIDWQEDFEKELEDSESSLDYNCDFYSRKQREEKSSDHGEVLLHNAAYGDDATSMESLLQQGADSNVVNNEGISPLHIALAHLNLPMVQLLLEYGGDLSLSPFNDGSDRTVADLLEIAGEEKSDELEEFVLGLIELLNFGCSDGFVWAERSNQYKNNYDLRQAQLDQVDDLMTLVEHRAELWKNLGADLPGFAYTDEESELEYVVENRDIERIEDLEYYILNDPDRIASVLEILEEVGVKSEYVNSWLEIADPAQHQNIICAIENDDKEVLDLLKEYDVEICDSENDETNGLCTSKNSNDLDEEYKGVENSGCTAIGMNKGSIHVSMQVISAHQSGYIKSIHGLLYNVCPSKRYLIIDSERERSDSILKSDLINAHPNIAIVFTGIQYDVHTNTASCADNVLLSLSIMREHKTYVLQINTLNYNHLITVVEYELWQEDEVMYKLMQVKSGRYEIEDSGDKIWNNYKEKFIDKTVKICETINAPCETTGSLSCGALMPIIEIPVAHEERFITIMNEINQSFRLAKSDSSSKMIMEETYDSIQFQGGVVASDVISTHNENEVGKLLHTLNERINKLGQEQDDRVEVDYITQQISDRSSTLVQPNYKSRQESDNQFVLIGEQMQIDIAINNKQEHSAVALIAGGVEEGIVPVTTLVITDINGHYRSDNIGISTKSGFIGYLANLAEEFVASVSSSAMSIGNTMTNGVMKNEYIKGKILNYVYYEKVVEVNSVIGKKYVQELTNSGVQEVLKKHPFTWVKKDFKNIKLAVHPDKGGNHEDFLAITRFEDQIGKTERIYENIYNKLAEKLQPKIQKVSIYAKGADVVIDFAKVYLKYNVENVLNTIYDGIVLYNKVYLNAPGASSVVMVTTLITFFYNLCQGDPEKAGIQGLNGLSYCMLNSKYLPGYELYAYAGLNGITIVYDWYKGERLEAGLQAVGIAGMIYAPTLTGAYYTFKYTVYNVYGLYQLYHAKQQENILGFNNIIARLLVKTINDNIHDEVIQNILRSISLDQRLEEAGIKEEVAIISNEYNERDDTDLISLEDIAEYLKDKNKVVIRQINNLDAIKLIKEKVHKLTNEGGGGALNYLKEYVGYPSDGISETKRVESIKLEIIHLLGKKDVNYNEVQIIIKNAIDVIKSKYLSNLYDSTVNNEVLKVLKEIEEEVLMTGDKERKEVEEGSKEYYTEEVSKMIVEKEEEEITITEVSPYKQLTGQTSEEQSYCNRRSKENEENKIYESIKCIRKDLDIADITNNKLHLPMMMGLDEAVAETLIYSKNNNSKDNNKDVLYYWNREHKSKLEELFTSLPNNQKLVDVIMNGLEESKSWIIPQSIKQTIITEEHIKEKVEKGLGIVGSVMNYGKSFFVSDNRSLDDRLDKYLVSKVTDKSKESDVATMIKIMTVNKEGCYIHGYVLDRYAEIIDHETVESNDSELCNNEISNYINKGDMDA